MTKIFIAFAAILAGLSVTAGAFASHTLKEKITDRALEIFQTGAQYQLTLCANHATQILFQHC